MASYYILKPVREAFFLQSQSMENVAKVHVVVSLATFFTVQAYAWLARRFTGRQLVTWVYASFVLTVVGFWAALAAGANARWQSEFAWIYYIWVSIFSVFAVTLFWSFSHDIFTPEEGGKFYGLIGAGGILGGIIGGIITSALVRRVGPMNLLLVSAGLLVPCVVIAVWLGARIPSSGGTGKGRPVADMGALRLFRSSSYLSSIFLFVFLYQAMAILVDNQTKLVLKQHYTSTEAFAEFYANVYAVMNGLGLMVNLLIAGPVQTSFGPLPGLLTLPTIGALGAVAFFVSPTIEVAAVVTTLGLAASYSIQQTSKELLYLPVPSKERFVAKAFIDTLGFRLGNGLASVWLWVVIPASGSVALCGMILASAMGMIGCASWVAPRHRAMLETSSVRIA